MINSQQTTRQENYKNYKNTYLDHADVHEYQFNNDSMEFNDSFKEGNISNNEDYYEDQADENNNCGYKDIECAKEVLIASDRSSSAKKTNQNKEQFDQNNQCGLLQINSKITLNKDNHLYSNNENFLSKHNIKNDQSNNIGNKEFDKALNKNIDIQKADFSLFEKKISKAPEKSMKNLEFNDLKLQEQKQTEGNKILYPLAESHTFARFNMEYKTLGDFLPEKIPNSLRISNLTSNEIVNKVAAKVKGDLQVKNITEKIEKKENSSMPIFENINSMKAYDFKNKINDESLKKEEIYIYNSKDPKPNSTLVTASPNDQSINSNISVQPSHNSRFNSILENSKRIIMELKEVSNDRSKNYTRMKDSPYIHSDSKNQYHLKASSISQNIYKEPYIAQNNSFSYYITPSNSQYFQTYIPNYSANQNNFANGSNLSLGYHSTQEPNYPLSKQQLSPITISKNQWPSIVAANDNLQYENKNYNAKSTITLQKYPSIHNLNTLPQTQTIEYPKSNFLTNESNTADTSLFLYTKTSMDNLSKAYLSLNEYNPNIFKSDYMDHTASNLQLRNIITSPNNSSMFRDEYFPKSDSIGSPSQHYLISQTLKVNPPSEKQLDIKNDFVQNQNSKHNLEINASNAKFEPKIYQSSYLSPHGNSINAIDFSNSKLDINKLDDNQYLKCLKSSLSTSNNFLPESSSTQLNQDTKEKSNENQNLRIELKKSISPVLKKYITKPGVNQSHYRTNIETTIDKQIIQENPLALNIEKESEQEIFNVNERVVEPVELMETGNFPHELSTYHQNDNNQNINESYISSKNSYNPSDSAKITSCPKIEKPENQEIIEINVTETCLTREGSHNSLASNEKSNDKEEEYYTTINKTECENKKDISTHFVNNSNSKNEASILNKSSERERSFIIEDLQERIRRDSEVHTNLRIFKYRSGEMIDDSITPKKQIENHGDKADVLYFEGKIDIENDNQLKKDYISKKPFSQKSTTSLKTISLNLEDNNSINQACDKKNGTEPSLTNTKLELKLITNGGAIIKPVIKQTTDAPQNVLQDISHSILSSSTLNNQQRNHDSHISHVNEQRFKISKAKIEDKTQRCERKAIYIQPKQELVYKENERKTIQDSNKNINTSSSRPKLQLVDNYGKISLCTADNSDENKSKITQKLDNKSVVKKATNANKFWEASDNQADSTKNLAHNNKYLLNYDKNTIQNSLNKLDSIDNTNNISSNSQSHKIKLELIEAKKIQKPSSLALISNVLKKSQEHIGSKKNLKPGNDNVVVPSNRQRLQVSKRQFI